MRRLLASEGELTPNLAPQPGLEALGDLLDRMRATGLAVELVTEGEARPLPVGVDLSVYRIVQEALTNTLKHGGDAPHARVLLRYTQTSIEIEMTDDGVGAAARSDGPAMASSGCASGSRSWTGTSRPGRVPVADSSCMLGSRSTEAA